MKVTSALANKKIKMLEEQKARILELEASSCIYIRADGEVESPPVYDYAKTQQEVTEINNKIRKIKHTVNVFNTTTYLEEIGLYIDEALVEMALLSKRKDALRTMSNRLPKERIGQRLGHSTLSVEYRCANYNVEKAKCDFEICSQRLCDIQVALDTANQTILFEIED